MNDNDNNASAPADQITTIELSFATHATLSVEELDFGHSPKVDTDVEVDWEIGGDTGSATVSTSVDLDDIEYEVRTSIKELTVKVDLDDAIRAVVDGLFDAEAAGVRQMINAPSWGSQDDWEEPDAKALDLLADAYADGLDAQVMGMLAEALVNARTNLRTELDAAVWTVKSNIDRVRAAAHKVELARKTRS